MTDRKGYMAACGCVLAGYPSEMQSARRAFLHGLTFGAFPADYPLLEQGRHIAVIEHIMAVHGDD